MRVLVACEFSGVVQQAFAARGHDAWSCDLLPTESNNDSTRHIQGNVLDYLDGGPFSDFGRWDLIIAHPPCTFLTVANNGPVNHGCSLYTAEQGKKYRAEAIQFFLKIAAAPVPKLAVENPIGIMSTIFRKPDQIIQPYHFGEDASKATCLWLRGLPPLRKTQYFPPRMVCRCGNVYPYSDAFGHGCKVCGAESSLAKPRWGNQTNSGQNKLTPSATRSTDRARTYPGIAAAMAQQWG